MATTAPANPASSSHTLRQMPLPTRSERLSAPKYQAYLLLRTAFVAAPILFGVDKFLNWMTYWPKYLWVGFPHFFSVSPQHFMYGVGVIEIAAGLGVLLCRASPLMWWSPGWAASSPTWSS